MTCQNYAPGEEYSRLPDMRRYSLQKEITRCFKQNITNLKNMSVGRSGYGALVGFKSYI